jgi:protein TonB
MMDQSTAEFIADVAPGSPDGGVALDCWHDNSDAVFFPDPSGQASTDSIDDERLDEDDLVSVPVFPDLLDRRAGGLSFRARAAMVGAALLSLLMHAGLIVAIFYICKWGLFTPPVIQFGFGDAAAESGLVDRPGDSEHTPGAAGGLPGAPLPIQASSDPAASLAALLNTFLEIVGTPTVDPAEGTPPIDVTAVDESVDSSEVLPAQMSAVDPASMPRLVSILPIAAPEPPVQQQRLTPPNHADNPIAESQKPPSQPAEPTRPPDTDEVAPEVASRDVPPPETSSIASDSTPRKVVDLAMKGTNPGSGVPVSATGSEVAAGERGAGTGSGRGSAGGGASSGDGGTAASGRMGIPDGIREHLPRPAYPRLSRSHGEQGTVLVEIEVLASGEVHAVRILSDAGYPRLGDAAAQAFRGWRFPPATQAGQSIACLVTIPIRFELSRKP